MAEFVLWLVTVSVTVYLAYNLGVRAERGRWERIERARVEFRAKRKGLTLRRLTIRR